MTSERFLYWAPRILGIFFALFISLFALDVFDEGYSPGETAIALLMHLIPTFLVIVTLLLAWKWEWVGLVVFVGMSIFYIIWAWGKFPISAYLAISGPLALAGLLFGLHWWFFNRATTSQ